MKIAFYIVYIFFPIVLWSSSESDSTKIRDLLSESANALYSDLESAKPLIFEGIELCEVQKDTFSEIQFLNILGNYYLFKSNLDSSLAYFIKGLNLNRQANHEILEPILLNNIGLVYRELGEMDSARSYYQSSIILEANNANTTGVVESCINLAVTHEFQGNYDKSIPVLYFCLNILDSLAKPNDCSLEAKVLTNLAVNFYQLGDLDKSATLFEEIYSKDCLSLDERVSNLDNLISVLLEQNKLDNILEYLDTLSSLSSQLGYPIYLMRTKENYGIFYHKNNELDTSYYYAMEALQICQDYDENSIYSVHGLLGRILHSQKKIDKSLEYLEKAKEGSEKYGDIRFANDLLIQMSELELKRNNTKIAYNYLKQYVVVNDSLANIDRQRSIQRYEIEYQTDLIKKENLLKDEQLKVKESEKLLAQSKSKMANWIAVLVGLITLVTVIFALRIRKKNKIIQEYQNRYIEPLNRTIQVKTAEDKNRKVEYVDLRDLVFLEKGGTDKFEYKLIDNRVKEKIGRNSFLIYTALGKKFVKKTTLKELLENDLKDSSFVRVDSSLIINLHFVRKSTENQFEVRIKDWNKENKRFEEIFVPLILAETGKFKTEFLESYLNFQEKSAKIASK